MWVDFQHLLLSKIQNPRGSRVMFSVVDAYFILSSTQDRDITLTLDHVPKYSLYSSFGWIHEFLFRNSHQMCPIKKVFLKISQNSQENTCVRVSFLITLFYRTLPDDCFCCRVYVSPLLYMWISVILKNKTFKAIKDKLWSKFHVEHLRCFAFYLLSNSFLTRSSKFLCIIENKFIIQPQPQSFSL